MINTLPTAQYSPPCFRKSTPSFLQQAMSSAAASSSVRQVLSASQHTVVRKTPLAAVGRRPMSAAAMALPAEEHPVIDLQIFDIFDAPSRLGESSKILAQAAANRTERTLSTRAVERTDDIQRTAVPPLPAPVMYDGPAKPKYLAHGPRIRRMYTQAASFSGPRENVCELPPPVVFDGPSRLRPYMRNDSCDGSVSLEPLASTIDLISVQTSSTTLLAGVAAAGTLAYATYEQLKEKKPSQDKSKR